jgi:hypothetical protein
MTVIAEQRPLRAADAGAAFATPTIVRFGAVLLTSALIRVPWQSAGPASGVFGVLGLCGLGYCVVVIHRMRKQSSYRPEKKDWDMSRRPADRGVRGPDRFRGCGPVNPARESLRHRCGKSGTAFAGIHNAWDAVVYHVVTRDDEKKRL